MAADRRSHSPCSFCSCLAPARVNLYNLLRRLLSDRLHSESIHPGFSSLVKAGYNDPCPTCRTSFDTCWMRWEIPHPCIGSSAKVLRIRRSSVPCSSSICSPTRILLSDVDKRLDRAVL